MQTTAPGHLVELQHSEVTGLVTAQAFSSLRENFYPQLTVWAHRGQSSWRCSQLLQTCNKCPEEALCTRRLLGTAPCKTTFLRCWQSARASPRQEGGQDPLLAARTLLVTQLTQRSSDRRCDTPWGDEHTPPSLGATWATGLLQWKCCRGAQGATEENGTRSSSWFSVTLQLWPTLDSVLSGNGACAEWHLLLSRRRKSPGCAGTTPTLLSTGACAKLQGSSIRDTEFHLSAALMFGKAWTAALAQPHKVCFQPSLQLI